MTRVTFVMMVAAKSVPVMVPVATVPGIGKDHIFVLIVAYPVAAARCLCQILRLAAQPASRTGFDSLLLWFCFYRHVYLFLERPI